MNSEKRKAFAKGRQYWLQYVNENGYSFAPAENGLKKLSDATGITKKELRHYINIFLAA